MWGVLFRSGRDVGTSPHPFCYGTSRFSWGKNQNIINYTDRAASDNGKKNATAGIGVNFADFRTNAEVQLGEFRRREADQPSTEQKADQ